MPSSHGGSPGFKSPIAHHIEMKRLFGFPKGLFFRFVSTIIFIAVVVAVGIAVPIPKVFTVIGGRIVFVFPAFGKLHLDFRINDAWTFVPRILF